MYSQQAMHFRNMDESEYPDCHELHLDTRLSYKSNIIRKGDTPKLTQKEKERMKKHNSTTMKEVIVSTFMNVCGCFR